MASCHLLSVDSRATEPNRGCPTQRKSGALDALEGEIGRLVSKSIALCAEEARSCRFLYVLELRTQNVVNVYGKEKMSAKAPKQARTK